MRFTRIDVCDIKKHQSFISIIEQATESNTFEQVLNNQLAYSLN